jgi:hypothetical protein
LPTPLLSDCPAADAAALPTDARAAIRGAVNRVGDANNGQSSVTGIKAFLQAEGVMVSTDEIFQVRLLSFHLWCHAGMGKSSSSASRQPVRWLVGLFWRVSCPGSCAECLLLLACPALPAGPLRVPGTASQTAARAHLLMMVSEHAASV